MAYTLYDDDDYRFSYENMNDWHNGDTTNFYNGGTHNSIGGAGIISRVKFKMNGTTFRLYDQKYTDGRNTNVKVIVDGVWIDTINSQSISQTGHILFYTSPTLIAGDHDINLEHDNSQSGFIMFDGIDTDGFIYAKPGNILSTPELGWQRIDNSDDKFTLFGTWTKSADGAPWGAYQNTWSWSQTAGDQIVFILKSTRLRIYTYGWTDTSGFDLLIDGVLYKTYSTLFGVSKTVMACDISGLTNGEHTIQIILKDKSLFSGSSLTRILFDCIDIDPSGYISSIGTAKILSIPETGWLRYDGSNTNVQMINFKQVEAGSSTAYMSGNFHVINEPSKPCRVIIKTTGSKIRLVAPLQYGCNKNVLVYRDGVMVDSFSAANANVIANIMYYETPDFSHPDKRFITVEFYYQDAISNPFFDCFDIYGGVLVQKPAQSVDENTGVSFEYTSQVISMLEVEIPGVYAIECWGGNGGGNYDRAQGSSGGWGGYSYGEKFLNQGDILYCVPGGQGIYATGYFNGGGFNGGGNGGSGGYGGGGGTDIRFGTNDLPHRILVAGGGGGADNTGGLSGGGDDGSGGHGGGVAGQGAWRSGVYYPDYGATQNSGYVLGVGQSATVATDTGGGGGGYWGGLVSNDNNGGAGGGSSYIGDLDNAYTLAGQWWGNGKVKLTLLQEDPRFNFQHYAIKCYDKFYIPNAAHFDTVSKTFDVLTMNDLIDYNQNTSRYITDIHDLFKPFSKNGKQYFPMNYIKTDLNLKIYKFIGHSDSALTKSNNHMRRHATFSVNFTNKCRATLIKMKDAIRPTFDLMKNYIVPNNSSVIRIGIEYNSTLFGKGFMIINENEVNDKGFTPDDLANLEIPFDNVRYFVNFSKNCDTATDELQSIKMIKRTRNLERILDHNDYAVLVKKDNENIYIQIINGAISSITVNKITKDTSYRVINALETF